MKTSVVWIDGRNDVGSILQFASLVTGEDTIPSSALSSENGVFTVKTSKHTLEFKKCPDCQDMKIESAGIKRCPTCGWAYERATN